MADEYGFIPDEEEKKKPVGAAPTDDYGFQADPETKMDKLKRYGKEYVLEPLIKGTQYIQGATVSPLIAMGTEAMTGKDVFKGDEYLEALKGGQAYPMPSQLLERGGIGIPEGYRVSDAFPSAKDKWYDFSTKGALEMGLDIATDPLTYIPFAGAAAQAEKRLAMQAAKEAAMKEAGQAAGMLGRVGEGAKYVGNKAIIGANKVMNPIEAFSKTRSTDLYKKAFEEIDRFGAEKGKKLAVSQLLENQGFSGNMDKAVDRVKTINRQSGLEIGKILDKADVMGAKVDLISGLEKATEQASLIRKEALTPEAIQLADEIDKRVMFAWEQSGAKPISVRRANRLKTEISEMISKVARDNKKDASMLDDALRQIEDSLRGSIENVIEQTDPQLAQKLKMSNEVFSSTDGRIQKKLRAISNRAPERKAFGDLSAIDLMLLGGTGFVGGEIFGIPGGGGAGTAGALALKMAGQRAKSTLGRTTRAATGQALSKSKVPSRMLFKSMNPWDIQPEEEKK
jgi:hypothetical protein